MKKYKVSYGGMLLGKEEEAAIKRVVKRNWWPTGEETLKMERESAEYIGVRHAVLANSGSSAGLLALAALELPKGSRVGIPATTFPTIFNIIVQLGLTPVVLDCSPATNNIDLDKLTPKILKSLDALIAVHAVGNPVDMVRLMALSDKFKFYVLEDFCDCFGGAIGRRRLGSFAHISFTSFHAAHIVSMGQGGGVFTDNPTFASNARMYRDWGRQATLTSRTNHKWKSLPKDYDSRFIYEKIGYNLSPLELQAAMGRIQLKKTDKIRRLRQKNYDYFREHLPVEGRLFVIETDPNIKDPQNCWFSLPMAVTGNERGRLTNFLENHGIETRSMFSGNILKHPAYGAVAHIQPHELNGSDWILEHSFWISVHPRLTDKDRKYVVKTFEKYFKLYP